MPTRRDLANAIRALSMDAVQKANSGHPGMPMGMADITEVLWNDFLRFNPANPGWHNRDRFVLSNGHGSMLLYSALHLSGYDLSLDELKNFRQLGSKTPGHPEYGMTPGVETTTGPLGQGLANAVGMAIAEKNLAARYNRPGFDIVNHETYVFAGDGCLMEGISHEVCSLAGTLGLGKLIVLYDDNGISIDGEVDGWFTEKTAQRFEAYGWHVIDAVDGHEADAVRRAIDVARSVHDKPTLICCRTVIGWGSPNKQGTADTHGAPLGDDEIAEVRKTIGWEHPPFEIPSEIRAHWDARERGAAVEAHWQELFAEYEKKYPELAAEYQRRMTGDLPPDWEGRAGEFIEQVDKEAADKATRKSSQAALNGFGPMLPELIGGSADLTGSNGTYWSGSEVMSAANPQGNYIYFGVREFGMSGILNGLALHGGFIPYGATFLVFSDYARNAVRLAALMKIPSIFVYTHDSVGLGEDGPTHQPVEHLASLRIIPDMSVWRPCDTVESAVAWRQTLEQRRGPASLVFTRQGVPYQPRSKEQIANIARGGYVLADCEGAPELVLIATGSEVALAMQASAALADSGRRVRVVSMPCADIFNQQDATYRDSVLPPEGRRIAIEAGVPDYWYRYVGSTGRVIGIERFGESAPGAQVFEHLGVTAERIVAEAESLLQAPAQAFAG
ncbi:MAG: transketolase [Gammaproteobacteria bacterium]|nr:transketolase [Gammaproteobacteria bacterium]NNF62429.1 transketolase [Gammaproteobacteria bacterium]